MKVFISYSHDNEDVLLADKIVSGLQKKGLDVWYDQRELMPGDNFGEKIGQALSEAKAMVVLLTPKALGSVWVQREIQYALGEERYSKRLIPVFIGDFKNKEKEKVPWILRQIHEIQGISIKLGKEQQGIQEGISKIAESLAKPGRVMKESTTIPKIKTSMLVRRHRKFYSSL